MPPVSSTYLSDYAVLAFTESLCSLTNASGTTTKELSDSAVLSATLLNLAGPVVFSTADGLAIADSDLEPTPVPSTPGNLASLFGDPLGGGGLFALDPQGRRLLYLSGVATPDIAVAVLADDVASYSASEKFLLVNNTVFFREARDGKPARAAYAAPPGVRLTDVDDDCAYAYDADAGTCAVISLADPGRPAEVLENVRQLWKGTAVALVLELEGGWVLSVGGRRFELPEEPLLAAASKTAYALWDDPESPTIVRPAAGPRALSFQYADGTGFLFDSAAAVFAIAPDRCSFDLHRCFGSTAVLIGDTVIAAEFGKVSLYPRSSRRVERDSVLALASAFVLDPLSSSQFFAYFADLKEVVVANKDLQIVPYLPNIESFDVSRAYFASIETGDALFVRRRDGGDDEPVIAGRPVPPGARVFVEDAAVYVFDPAVAAVTRIDLNNDQTQTIKGVTAIWSTEKVVVEVDGERHLVDGETELRIPRPVLAVAIAGTVVSSWSSVSELPTCSTLPTIDSDSDLLRLFGGGLTGAARAAIAELLDALDLEKEVADVVNKVKVTELPGYPDRLVASRDRFGILLISIAAENDLNALALLSFVSPTKDNAQALTPYLEKIKAWIDDEDDPRLNLIRTFEDLSI
jgi:hypothetical protein